MNEIGEKIKKKTYMKRDLLEKHNIFYVSLFFSEYITS